MQQARSRRTCTISLQAVLLLAVCTYACLAPADALLNVGQHLKAVGEAAMGAVDPRLWDIAQPTTDQGNSANLGQTSDPAGAAVVAGEMLEEAHQHAMKLVEQAHAAMLQLNMPQPAGGPTRHSNLKISLCTTKPASASRIGCHSDCTPAYRLIVVISAVLNNHTRLLDITLGFT